jgi:hypothetical protein
MVLALLTANVVLAAPSRACACGAAVAPQGSHATMNHEVALVHWDGTTETIVMQLAMNASTDNIALVVPTPAPATVTSADKAAFTELDSLSAPQIVKHRHWRVGLALSSTARHAAARAPGAPTVLNQVHLGPLEVTTLAGGDVAGLQKWLSDNGYAIRPEVSDALGPYFRDNWSFVAMKLTSNAPIVGGLNPVRMTFPSSQLVYPMRLSVAATNTQEVTVFTLSDHRQQRTDPDAATQSTEVQFAGNVANAVHDPLLRELAANHGAFLTKIVVNAKPEQITSDFSFGNAPNDDAYRQVVVVDDDVVIPIDLVVLGLLVLGAIATTVLFLVLRGRRRPA